MMTGTQHGAIDFEWLMANLEVGSVPYGVDEEKVGEVDTFVLGSKAVYAAEAYVLGLFQLYPTVYFHKTTRGAEKIFGELLFRVISLSRDKGGPKTGLPPKHPLRTFATNSNDLERLISLDDTVLWGSLNFLTEASDPTVQSLARRLQDRKLYKCIDVRESLLKRLGDDADEEVVEHACQGIDTKITEWLATRTDVAPRIITDRAEREPYRRFQDSKGPLNQIRIRAGGGGLVDLVKRSKVVAAINMFKLYRVYVSDAEAREFVERAIDEEGTHGGKN